MNQKLKEIALQIGGSHYPDVQKIYMEPTVRAIIDECAKAIGEEHKSTLLKHFDLQ